MVGLFINTIPKRIIMNDEMKFIDLLEAVLQDDISTIEHHSMHLSDIVKSTPLGPEVFDHVIVFENQYQLMDVKDEFSTLDFSISGTESYDPNEYNLSVFIHHYGDQLSFEVRFNETMYDRSEVEQVVGTLSSIMTVVADNKELTVNNILMEVIDEELELPEFDMF